MPSFHIDETYSDFGTGMITYLTSNAREGRKRDNKMVRYLLLEEGKIS